MRGGRNCDLEFGPIDLRETFGRSGRLIQDMGEMPGMTIAIDCIAMSWIGQ